MFFLTNDVQLLRVLLNHYLSPGTNWHFLNPFSSPRKHNSRTLGYLGHTAQTVSDSKFDLKQLVSNEIAETQKKGWIKEKEAITASDRNNLTLSNLKFYHFEKILLSGVIILKMEWIFVKMLFSEISSRVFASSSSGVAIYSYHMLKLKILTKPSSLKECKIQ